MQELETTLFSPSNGICVYVYCLWTVYGLYEDYSWTVCGLLACRLLSCGQLVDCMLAFTAVLQKLCSKTKDHISLKTCCFVFIHSVSIAWDYISLRLSKLWISHLHTLYIYRYVQDAMLHNNSLRWHEWCVSWFISIKMCIKIISEHCCVVHKMLSC
jgi:hypothetical protein